jgi:hypothetical protein
MFRWCRALGARLLAELLAPAIAAWSWTQERSIRRQGRCLSPQERTFAQNLGITHAINVRVLSVMRVPLPLPLWLLRLADRWQIGCPNPAGMTLGHGIYALEAWSADFALISHELVHVLQYQRCRGHWHFMRDYLRQCLSFGYDSAPMELEARERSGS